MNIYIIILGRFYKPVLRCLQFEAAPNRLPGAVASVFG